MKASAAAVASAGRPLTAEDLVWNIERQKAGVLQDGSEGAFGRKDYWSKVESIDSDAGAMTLNLAKPDAPFLQGLGNEFGPVRVRVNVIPDEELAWVGVTIEGAFDIADWDLTRGGNFPDGVVERS